MELIDDYEAFRPQGPDRPVVSGRGEALLVRYGMVAWLRAWKECRPPAAALPRDEKGATPIPNEELRSALTSQISSRRIQHKKPSPDDSSESFCLSRRESCSLPALLVLRMIKDVIIHKISDLRLGYSPVPVAGILFYSAHR